jgi:hypothetical protein
LPVPNIPSCIISTCQHRKRFDAGAICEPWFTGSREICELWKNVNHKSKFTEKMCELGSQKFGSRILFISHIFFFSNTCEPSLCELSWL